MAGNGRKTKALAALLSGETVSGAARISGAGERTVFRWLSEPGFKKELESRQALILENVSGSLMALTEQAVEALEQVLHAPHEPGANSKRLAAVSILALALKVREVLKTEEQDSMFDFSLFGEK